MLMATATVATYYTSTTSNAAQETNSSTSSSFSSSSSSDFIGSKPSTVLFFVALCIGIAIAFTFIFFTFRYLVRSRFGMYMASPPYGGGAPFEFAGADRGIFAPYLMNDSLTYAMGLAQGDNLGNPHRYRVARRKKLTAEELDEMFPVSKYSEWLEGGEEEAEEAEMSEKQPQGGVGTSSDNNRAEGEGKREKEGEKEGEGKGEGKEEGEGEGSVNTEEFNTSNEKDKPESKKPWPRYTSGDCTICLDTFTDDCMVRGLSCGHAFHVECIDPWLTGKRGCCPTCKHDFVEDVDGSGRGDGNPDFRDFDSLFDMDRNDNSNVIAYHKPTEFKANTLLCAMLLSRIGRYHTGGPVDLDGLEDDEGASVESEAVTRPERAVVSGSEGEEREREENENNERQSTDSRHPSANQNFELQSTASSFDNYLDAESTVSESLFQARDTSISPTAPPLPDIHRINRHICRILENHPFNVDDLDGLDVLAHESANRMFRWYTLPFWRAMGIRKPDMYYYFVVWYYQKKKNERVATLSRREANEHSGAHDEPRARHTQTIPATRTLSGRLYDSAYNILDTVRQRRDDRHRERHRRHRARERSRREAVEDMV